MTTYRMNKPEQARAALEALNQFSPHGAHIVPIARDWASEVRDTLYRAHGLRAWELALESGRLELVALVESVTGGLEFSYDDKRHMVWLCDVMVATARQTFTVRDQPGGPVRVDRTFIQNIHREPEIVLLVKAAIKKRLGKLHVTTRLSRSEALELTAGLRSDEPEGETNEGTRLAINDEMRTAYRLIGTTPAYYAQYVAAEEPQPMMPGARYSDPI